MKNHKSVKERKFDHEILLFQGGGALGAYHAGVYEGLVEAGRQPTWVVGVSIGGITSALIAGNPPEAQVDRLREFWDRVSEYSLSYWPTNLDSIRPTFNYFSAATVATFGCPGFFEPRVPPPFLWPIGGPEATSFYDTSPLKRTLEELVDFDRINSGEMRVSLGAANVRTGESVYFDNRITSIAPEHVIASGALPPGFAAVEIDGEHYWDGGLVSNSPLTYVWDERPLTSALILQIDLFNALGELPRNLEQVLERQKEIQYASKQRFNTARAKELGDRWGALNRLIGKLPDELKDDADAKALAVLCDDREWTIARLVNQRLPHVSSIKDYEFSRATVREHWAAGLEDVRLSVANREELKPSELGPGVKIYSLPGNP